MTAMGRSKKIRTSNGPPRRPLVDRLMERVVTSDGCWLWTGATAKGYGKISRGGHRGGVMYAHRASWEIQNGPIPDGMAVCHRCDTPLCVRAEHLFLGTPQENANDMKAKGRSPLGSLRTNAKLTEKAVQEIRAQLAAGVQQVQLARKYGVSRSAVWAIAHMGAWRHA